VCLVQNHFRKILALRAMGLGKSAEEAQAIACGTRACGPGFPGGFLRAWAESGDPTGMDQYGISLFEGKFGLARMRPPGYGGCGGQWRPETTPPPFTSGRLARVLSERLA
jgi:hypothetical protein